MGPVSYNPQLEELARRFREGIANAIGVPPEYIDEEKVRRWVENWVKAWVKPEYWSKLGLSAEALRDFYVMGYELGEILKRVL